MSTDAAPSLRELVNRGGRALFLRQALGILIATVAVVGITRIIGPAAYGVYAAFFAVAFLAQTWGELSLDVFLVRKGGELSQRTVHQVFTLLLPLAVVMTGLLVAVAGPLTALMHLPNAHAVAVAMFLGIPLVHLQQVPLSLLERHLTYTVIGVVEMAGQVVFLVVSLSAALFGAGVWSLVMAWYGQQLVLLIGFWSRAGYRPRLVWHADEVSQLLQFGLPATASSAAYATRNLVPPLLVAPLLGPAAVGYLALAARLVDQCAFIRNVITRMSFAVVGRLSGEPARLRRAVGEAMEAQVLAVGVPLALASLLAPVLIPMVFGSQWRQASTLVALLGPGVLATAMFSIHLAVLVGRRRPWEVVVVNAINATLFWLASIVLVPNLGIRGYGWADVGTIFAWVIAPLLYARRHPSPAYRFAVTWGSGLALAMIAPATSLWLLVLAALLLLNPPSVRHALAMSQRALSKRPSA